MACVTSVEILYPAGLQSSPKQRNTMTRWDDALSSNLFDGKTPKVRFLKAIPLQLHWTEAGRKTSSKLCLPKLPKGDIQNTHRRALRRLKKAEPFRLHPNSKDVLRAFQNIVHDSCPLCVAQKPR